MKLVRYTVDGRAELFGVVLGERVYSFDGICKSLGRDHPELLNIETYIQTLPRSEEIAAALLEDRQGREGEGHAFADIKILPPISRPPALIDFGLSPRHLANSTLTTIKHEWGRLPRALLTPVVRRIAKKMRASATMPYYKCNHNAIIGDGDCIGWPEYTSYLDVEPELGVVIGTEAKPIAGYLIYNDASARDVQSPEMLGTGPSRSKDFDHGQGIGPFIVTPDEVGDPLSLDVHVKVGSRYNWHGSTSEYKEHPEEVARFIRTVFTPLPGTIFGMGTVPDCTGLDNDQWIEPGDLIEISFSKLGTLRQSIPREVGPRLPSRWEERPGLFV